MRDEHRIADGGVDQAQEVYRGAEARNSAGVGETGQRSGDCKAVGAAP